MNDQLKSLSRLFTGTLFRIPDYQRGYSWEGKEFSDFWNDLCRLVGDKNHYVGVLTLEPISADIYSGWVDDLWLLKSKNFKPFYVVDGQQRLTTSIILIESIVETMKKKRIARINFTSKDEIVKQFIFESMDTNSAKTFIFSYEPENPSYDYLVTMIYGQNSELSTSFQQTTYTSNLCKAKEFFLSKLAQMNISEIEDIYRKLTQHFLFNTYEIASDIDVFVTFETMNNRGKRLTQLELLKNRLIYISTLFESQNGTIERLRRNINACWKDVYHYLGRNRNKQLTDDDFLCVHYRLYFGKHEDSQHMYMRYNFQISSLLDELFIPENVEKGKIDIDTIFKYIESIKNYVRLWNYINTPEYMNYSKSIIELLTKISYLTSGKNVGRANIDNLTIKTFLMACLNYEITESDIRKLLKTMERYLFFRLLFHEQYYYSDGIKKFDFDGQIDKIVKGDINISEITEQIDKINNSIAISNELNEKLISVFNRTGFYHTSFLIYFLCEYEFYLMSKSKTQIIKLDRDVLFEEGYETIEHIYPKNSHKQYWIDMFKPYTSKQRNSIRESLGNFVAISKSKNGALGNRSFPEKKGDNRSRIGYMYGTYAEAELCNYKDWGANEILSRGLILIDFLERRWDIQIGSGKISEKKRFLGLDFIDFKAEKVFSNEKSEMPVSEI